MLVSLVLTPAVNTESATPGDGSRVADPDSKMRGMTNGPCPYSIACTRAPVTSGVPTEAVNR